MNANQELPRWNLTNVYPDLDHPDFSQAVERLEQLIEDLKVYLDDHQIDPAQSPLHREPVELAEVISGFIERTAQAQELRETLRAYLNSFISTDSFNEKAKKQLSLLEPTFVKLDQIEAVKFQGWLGKLGDKIDQVIGLSPTVTEHAFYLTNTVEQSVYMMSPAEEELASELFLSGATAWNKLQSNLTSQLSWPLENENGEETPLPMTAIINLRSHRFRQFIFNKIQYHLDGHLGDCRRDRADGRGGF